MCFGLSLPVFESDLSDCVENQPTILSYFMISNKSPAGMCVFSTSVPFLPINHSRARVKSVMRWERFWCSSAEHNVSVSFDSWQTVEHFSAGESFFMELLSFQGGCPVLILITVNWRAEFHNLHNIDRRICSVLLTPRMQSACTWCQTKYQTLPNPAQLAKQRQVNMWITGAWSDPN